ncbi:STP1 protein [Plasmodium ovale wallikeri]|uniref:STP1 protein n=1 Tax=Plasmodium ovale wallikeri TaxID=864142 RepID=A0A1A9AF61_PLAOA|nr:STP1 protein [Plasmodium ovale wallikeri]
MSKDQENCAGWPLPPWLPSYLSLENDEDGIDYKNLCDQLNKYVISQKRCVRDVIQSKKRTFERLQWKDIIKGLVLTYNKQDIKRLCYYEDDKETRKKKDVLNIHSEFRNFCIEKKARLQKLSDMDFEQCSEYLSWINEKKMYLQGIDPNYEYIQEYQEYYNIHRNCNYPWLVGNINDVTCSQLTKTRAAKKDKENTVMGDNNQNPSLITHVTPSGEKKDISPPAQPSAKGDVDPPSAKTSDSIPGKEPTKTTTTDHSNNGHNDGEQIRNSVLLTGNPVSVSPPASETPPVPELISVSKNSADYNDPKYHQFLHHLRSNLDGYKIPFHDYHIIHKIPVKLFQSYKTYEEHIPSEPTITKPYIWYPAPLPRSRRYPDPFSRERMYPPASKSMRTHASFFPPKLPPLPIITSGNKKMEVVRIQLPTPDPSLFRSPVMIYTLVFLYTTFGLLFDKNKKKKRLKRQLQITKLSKEVPHFNTMGNYSISDSPYENKKGNEKNIYNKIKMQKCIIHKNIILPKKKKKNRKAIIDIHMELLNECKNDEWELNKDDFLQICLEQFIKEQNKIYRNSKNSNLITKNLSTQNAKEAKMLLWDKWAEKYTPIWENFKRGNTFKLLQYYWKEEENAYFHKIKNENSSLNQNEKFSYIQIKKDIWKRWTTKQAKLIEQYKEEQWFKSLVEELENVSDGYKKGKIKDDKFVENIKELENKENNEKLYKLDKHIFLIKVLIQILMMVIEECIKEENPEQTEVVLDNLINKLNKGKHENTESENIHQENMNHKE